MTHTHTQLITTLQQLKVTQIDLVNVDNTANSVTVHFTPTIPHCSMATLIGLSIRVRLLRALPRRLHHAGEKLCRYACGHVRCLNHTVLSNED